MPEISERSGMRLGEQERRAYKVGGGGGETRKEDNLWGRASEEKEREA